MKLASVAHNGERIVAIINPATSQFWPLSEIIAELPRQAGTEMVQAVSWLAERPPLPMPGKAGRPLDAARLLAPIARPPQNVMCVGKNYRAHAREFTRSGFDAGATEAEAVPQHPIIFTKPATSISGPEDDIPLWPGLDQAVDYEVELAVVIGKAGRLIPRAQAMEHVFGYTVINDVTARDLQRQHKQWFLGKAIDGFCPMGPCIVTADEIDLGNLRVSCRVNGEVRQDANTADLIFDVPTLIETISRSLTLVPGDIIATGTPEGVGIGFNPPRFLREGDLVEAEIEGIGCLRNTVRQMRHDWRSGVMSQPEAVT